MKTKEERLSETETAIDEFLEAFSDPNKAAVFYDYGPSNSDEAACDLCGRGHADRHMVFLTINPNISNEGLRVEFEESGDHELLMPYVGHWFGSTCFKKVKKMIKNKGVDSKEIDTF